MPRVILVTVAALMVIVLGLPAHAEPESECVPTRRGFMCSFGPLTLEPGSNEFASDVAAPSVPGYITYARGGLYSRNGDLLPSHAVHIHHAWWEGPVVGETLCPMDDGLVYSSGQERIRMNYPDGYGHYWRGDPSFEWSAMLDNMHDTPITAYVRLNLHFEERPEGDLKEVRNNFVPVTECGEDSRFNVTKGEGTGGRTRRSLKVEMPVSGRFVWGAAHLHDGGIKMVLKNLTRDKTILQSRALYEDPDHRWHLTGVTSYSKAPGGFAAAGDTLKVIAVYDSTHSWRGVMGNFRLGFSPIE